MARGLADELMMLMMLVVMSMRWFVLRSDLEWMI